MSAIINDGLRQSLQYVTGSTSLVWIVLFVSTGAEGVRV